MKKGHQLLKYSSGGITKCALIVLGMVVSSLVPLLGLDAVWASSNNELLSVYPSQMTKLSLSLVYVGAEVDDTINTTQSFAITDKYFIVVQANSAKEDAGWIVATDFANPSSEPTWMVKYDVGHGNGATWDSRRNQIVIVDGVTKHYFDANTGEFIEDFSEGMFATGIAYDADDDWYIQTSSSNEISGRILDNRFNLLMTFDAGHGLVNQDVAYNDGHIYRIGWGGCWYFEINSKKDAAAYCRRYFGEGSNVIYDFDMNGDFVKAYYINKGFGELESMAFGEDGTPYLLFNGKPDVTHYAVYRVDGYGDEDLGQSVTGIAETTGKEILAPIQKIDSVAVREALLQYISNIPDQMDDDNDGTNDQVDDFGNEGSDEESGGETEDSEEGTENSDGIVEDSSGGADGANEMIDDSQEEDEDPGDVSTDVVAGDNGNDSNNNDDNNDDDDEGKTDIGEVSASTGDSSEVDVDEKTDEAVQPEIANEAITDDASGEIGFYETVDKDEAVNNEEIIEGGDGVMRIIEPITVLDDVVEVARRFNKVDTIVRGENNDVLKKVSTLEINKGVMAIRKGILRFVSILRLLGNIRIR